MARRNHPKHPKRTRKNFFSDRYDLDYVSLPECPGLIRIIAKPYKTIYINLDADFLADDFYVVRDDDDKIMRMIAERI